MWEKIIVSPPPPPQPERKPEIDWLEEAETAKKMQKPKTQVSVGIPVKDLFRRHITPNYTMTTEEQFKIK